MNEQAHPDVTSKIVENGVCIGCGVCAGVCPSKVLEMTWQENGDRVPIKVEACPSKCDLCLRVCPFNDHASDEDSLAIERFGEIPGIQYDEAVGYYLSTYVGYSAIGEQRSQGSSGGMATWMLERILNTGHVDAVACVGRGKANDKLFTYEILEDIMEVRAAASSRYYPVDIADVMRRLSTQGPDKRYAVIGLPCTLKALQLAMLHIPILRRRVVFLLGLVCSHLPNRYYTEYLARLSGITPKRLSTVDYRLKGDLRAGNFYFQARTHDRIEGRRVPFLGKVSCAWTWGYFQYNACTYCDDVFAEVADAVFMDAWLPEYENDPKGHSLVILRHPELKQTLVRGIQDNTCCLRPISIEKVVASQKALVYRKKTQIAGRLYRAQRRGEWVPRKRIAPSEATLHTHNREIEALYAVQRISKESWLELRQAPLWRFYLRMLRVDWPLRARLWRGRFRRIVSNPWLLLRLLLPPIRQFLKKSTKENAFVNSKKE